MSRHRTPEQKAKARDYSRAYRKQLTPEQLARKREYERIRRLHRTPEQLAKSKEYYRVWRKFIATPEQKTRHKKYNLQWNKNNPEQYKRNNKRYQIKNREKIREREKAYRQRRMEKNSEYRTNSRLRAVLKGRIYKAVKMGYKSAHTAELLGCTLDQFKAHIECLWLPGMTWENYGFCGWHLDHKIPIASFDLADPEQQKQCFHWTNFQPLWAEDNFKKGARITEPPRQTP